LHGIASLSALSFQELISMIAQAPSRPTDATEISLVAFVKLLLTILKERINGA